MAAVVSCYCKPSPFLGQFFPSHPGKLLSRQRLAKIGQTCKISALFWGQKKSVQPNVSDFSIDDVIITGSDSEGGSASQVTPKKISISVISSISEVSPNEWDACCLDATGPEKINPFLSHGFLSSLEESGSSTKETGWMPSHIVAKDECENILGVVPLYLKSHSYGEFVFDHSWADAYYGFGSRYYPKFQCCVLFTPVTGPRILVRNISFRDQVFDIIVGALKDLTIKSQVSSLHITFSSENEWHKLKGQGFLPRIGMQYHWKNRNYKNFDEFLMDMKQNKRKNIRQERKKTYFTCMKHGFFDNGQTLSHWVPIPNNIPLFLTWSFSRQKKEGNKAADWLANFARTLPLGRHEFDVPPVGIQDILRDDTLGISAQNLTMKRLRGDEIKATHWDSFYNFYRNTTDNKWGTPYLTREFFHIMGSKMGDQVLLVIAEEGDELVAGALNLIGGDTIYGRLWGCHPRVYYPGLHFEACYYQAIEAAIELDLSTVEAGAQGEHKIQRGYLPVTTYSCHYLVDEAFRKAIGDFVVREASQVNMVMKLLHDSGPFKEGLHLK